MGSRYVRHSLIGLVSLNTVERGETFGRCASAWSQMYPKTLPTGTSCPSLYTYRRKPLAGAETFIFTLLVSTSTIGCLISTLLRSATSHLLIQTESSLRFSRSTKIGVGSLMLHHFQRGFNNMSFTRQEILLEHAARWYRMPGWSQPSHALQDTGSGLLNLCDHLCAKCGKILSFFNDQ